MHIPTLTWPPITRMVFFQATTLCPAIGGKGGGGGGGGSFGSEEGGGLGFEAFSDSTLDHSSTERSNIQISLRYLPPAVQIRILVSVGFHKQFLAASVM